MDGAERRVDTVDFMSITFETSIKNILFLDEIEYIMQQLHCN